MSVTAAELDIPASEPLVVAASGKRTTSECIEDNVEAGPFDETSATALELSGKTIEEEMTGINGVSPSIERSSDIEKNSSAIQPLDEEATPQHSTGNAQNGLQKKKENNNNTEDDITGHIAKKMKYKNVYCMPVQPRTTTDDEIFSQKNKHIFSGKCPCCD